MNKIAIPALLLGVVMIAGAFAFMPVQEASTVHTSAASTSTSMKYVTVSDTCTITGAGECDSVTVNVTAGDEYQLVSLAGNMGVDVVAQTKVFNLAACTSGVNDDVTNIDLPQFTSATATAEDEQDLVATDNVGVGSAITDEINCGTTTQTAAHTAGTVTMTFTFIMNGDATDPVVTIAN